MWSNISVFSSTHSPHSTIINRILQYSVGEYQDVDTIQSLITLIYSRGSVNETLGTSAQWGHDQTGTLESRVRVTLNFCWHVDQSSNTKTLCFSHPSIPETSPDLGCSCSLGWSWAPPECAKAHSGCWKYNKWRSHPSIQEASQIKRMVLVKDGPEHRQNAPRLTQGCWKYNKWRSHPSIQEDRADGLGQGWSWAPPECAKAHSRMLEI